MKPDIPGVTPSGREVIRILRPGSWKKAELRLVQTPEGPCVEKDYRDLSPLLRLYSSVILRREKQAYRALRDVPCIPHCYECAGGLLVIEYVEGMAISRLMGRPRGPAAFRNLERCVQAMHDQGVYHLDLRKRDNLLVTEEDQVWLVDFASATRIRPGTLKSWLLRGLLEFFDGYAVLKWKSVLDPDRMTSRDWSRVKWLNRIRFRT
jgi:RIO-like serine/threonine protein kinase